MTVVKEPMELYSQSISPRKLIEVESNYHHKLTVLYGPNGSIQASGFGTWFYGMGNYKDASVRIDVSHQSWSWWGKHYLTLFEVVLGSKQNLMLSLCWLTAQFCFHMRTTSSCRHLHQQTHQGFLAELHAGVVTQEWYSLFFTCNCFFKDFFVP